ncbi:hypothetical protein, partial [Methylobacterium goesingense]|uniref:hypothetical protein n=1 Tax=Methylobacterium goesingense TaxID=243690 RepID=UPI001EE24F3E
RRTRAAHTSTIAERFRPGRVRDSIDLVVDPVGVPRPNPPQAWSRRNATSASGRQSVSGLVLGG